MLTKIEVSNYKSIAHAVISLSKDNVVVGPNGVGKSNLIDAINFVRDAASDGIDHAITKRHGIVSIRRWSKTRPYNISIKMNVQSANGSGEYRILLSSAKEGVSILEEEGSWYGRHPFLDASDKEAVLCSFKRNAGKPLSFFFQDLHQELVSCGSYSIYPNKIREPQSISNSDVLADDGTNLASIIRTMRASPYRSNRESLTSAIQQVLPIVSEIRIESAGGFYVPVFRVREVASSSAHDLNMSQISDGTLRMLGMLTAFYQPRAPRKVTLEEPEQMIHPGLLPVLIDAARDYLDGGEFKQFILTTHSPTLLDLFEPEHVISTSFQDGISKFAPLSQRQLKIVQERLFTVGELLSAEGLSE